MENRGRENKMSHLLIVTLAAVILAGVLQAAPPEQEKQASKLAVVWTSGDPEVAHNVCFMYAHNAKKRGWFDEVVLIVWGPSSKLLAEDKSLQDKLRAMAADGVKLQACKACADSYGVSDPLEKLGVEVKYMGMPLTEMLQSGWKVLTF